MKILINETQLKYLITESKEVIGGTFETDLENSPKHHSKRAFGNWQSDNAWDIFSPPGTVVNSYTDGVVKRVKRTNKTTGKVFGTQITIKGDNDYPDIFYTHLKNVNLEVGDKVKVGDYIGEISEWDSAPKITHVHIGLPVGQHLKDLLNRKDSSKIFSGTKSKSIETNDEKKIDSKIDFSKGGFNSEQTENINQLINVMNEKGIKDPITQVGILSVIAKESGFKSFIEKGYCNTDDSRIIKVFGDRGRKCKDKKCNDEEFFDCVYGYKSGTHLGNDQPGDGWKYVGRGLNGITGKANYKKYGELIGVDLVSNPKLLEKPEIAAKVAIAFFTKGKSPESLEKFDNTEEASKYFAEINAGGRSGWWVDSAKKQLDKFEIT